MGYCKCKFGFKALVNKMNEYQEAQKQISHKDQKGKACDDGI